MAVLPLERHNLALEDPWRLARRPSPYPDAVLPTYKPDMVPSIAAACSHA
jgi:hypothetical protein